MSSHRVLHPVSYWPLDSHHPSTPLVALAPLHRSLPLGILTLLFNGKGEGQVGDYWVGIFLTLGFGQHSCYPKYSVQADLGVMTVITAYDTSSIHKIRVTLSANKLAWRINADKSRRRRQATTSKRHMSRTSSAIHYNPKKKNYGGDQTPDPKSGKDNPGAIKCETLSGLQESLVPGYGGHLSRSLREDQRCRRHSNPYP